VTRTAAGCILIAFGLLFATGCGQHDAARREHSRFTKVARWESGLRHRLTRRFREPIGRVDCEPKGGPPADHLFCSVEFPTTPRGKCDTRAYDVSGRHAKLVIRPAVEDWYCIVNVSGDY
jgi:hypothetical protein